MGLTIVPAPVVASVNLQETQILSSTTFTVPAGVTKLWASVYGGGGGAVYLSGNSQIGSNGLAGAVVTEQLTVTPGASLTATIGAGGTGSGSPSGSGSNSVFSTITAAGGNGFVWYLGSASAGYGMGKPGQSSFGTSPVGANAPANSSAGGGFTRTIGRNGGSGRIIVRYLA